MCLGALGRAWFALVQAGDICIALRSTEAASAAGVGSAGRAHGALVAHTSGDAAGR